MAENSVTRPQRPAPPEGLGPRLMHYAKDPSVLANPPTAVAFCVLRAFGLIAPLPYWVLVVVVAVGGTTSIVATALWGDDSRPWHLPAYLCASCGVVCMVAYASGWGPVLSVGFVFAAGGAFKLFGSRATHWCMAWTTIFMGAGQAAIALHLAPTMIRQPLIHGLAVLSLLGALLTIALLGHATSLRESAASELSHSESKFKALVSNAADIIVVVDAQGRLQYVSPSFERVLGLSPSEYEQRSLGDVVHPDDLVRVNSELAGIEDPEQTLRTTLRISDARGDWRQFEASVTNRLADPDVGGIVGNLHDNTELLEAHERFRSAFEDAPIGIAMIGLDGKVLRSNRAYGAIVGRRSEDLVGTHLLDHTHDDDAEVAGAELRRIARADGGVFTVEQRLLNSEGGAVWVMVHGSCVRDAVGRPLYLIVQVQDVTEQHTMRERLAHAAIHDPLTGLPNRVLFMDRLGMALARAERTGRRVAVAFLDLDRFKLVNDGLGHAAGDELLVSVAERLAKAVRQEDTVARFGGDEFTVLWEDLDDEESASVAAQRVLDDLQRPFTLGGAPAYVTASIGMAVAESSSTPATLLRDADGAMYGAKKAGRGRIVVFDGTDHEVALENLHVMNTLHAALAEEQFRLHYQPIVELHSGAVVGVEALVRWQHPTRGMLGPSQFIPMAEDSGLIESLGRWVLEQACMQAATRQKRLLALGARQLEIHVNISPRQLGGHDFLDTVSRAIERAELTPEALCLEITESTLMDDVAVSTEVLRSLRSLGVRISIDDFGTGYSSLSYLKRFQIDSLKVDRSFVEGLGEENDDSAIVAAIVGLAHSLGLTAVAEGVETERALEALARMGCDRVQGYMLGRPQSADELGDALFEPVLVSYASGA
ncbi:MAG: putative bifunctional diguanylate cyclase/phosphodiesterase [Acidimicrobiales bacterium]